MQVKGHIAKMAVCLDDSDPRISSLASLFFEELSHKVTKVPPRPRTASEARPCPPLGSLAGPSAVAAVPTPTPDLQHLLRPRAGGRSG